MEPTLRPGATVFVEKMTLGARVDRTPFRNSGTGCIRLPGTGRLRPGDIVVCNSPEGGGPGVIKINSDTVLVKRCIGTPGDTVRIVRGFYLNSSAPGFILCPAETQKRLSLLTPRQIDSIQTFKYTLPGVPWSVIDFGPMVVPSKGTTILFDSLTVNVYSAAVQYETGDRPIIGQSYTFRNDWYFIGGDNVLNSRDSRYFGPVPEEFIIGRVLTHKRSHTKARNKYYRNSP